MKKCFISLLILLSGVLAAQAARYTQGFADFTDGEKLSIIGSNGTTAVVSPNPVGAGKVLIVQCHAYGEVPVIPVRLPSGVTLGNLSSLSAKMYIPSAGNEQYANYKQIQIFINGGEVFRNLGADGKDEYPYQGEKNTWLNKTFDISSLSLTPGMTDLNEFDLGFGLNDDDMTYYIGELTFSYELNLDPPVIPAEGAYYTGTYRNLFAEAGYDDAMVEQRIAELWATYFEGDNENERLFYPVEGDMAYILDVNNNDVRSEGMSYGMMLCVQLDKQKEFDALWKWAKTNMQHPESDGDRHGYFAWQCNRDGSKKDGNTASDGEEYFIMALMFASNRWGDGEGIFNYGKEAENILNVAVNRPKQNQYAAYTPIFDHQQMQVVFVPYASAAGFTDPSYHLPAFYELWALWAPKDNDFFRGLARKSREMYPRFAHPVTGLMPDYADFDGSPHQGDGDHAAFLYDAWRCIMNMAIDFAWFKPEGNSYQDLVARLYKFFISKGVTDYHSVYNLDGTNKNGNSDHSPGLVACNASGALASDSRDAWKFIDNFVDTPVPTGKFRYYDGCLYFLNWLNCAGRYRIYPPELIATGLSPELPSDSRSAVTVCGDHIMTGGSECGKYEIISLPAGLKMASGTYTDGSIPANNLTHGLYILRTENEKSNHTTKFIY